MAAKPSSSAKKSRSKAPPAPVAATSNTATSTSSSSTNQETTRICIKNVPPSFTEPKLRSHLTTNARQKLIITDCKILRTKDGKSRKLAFVGFKDEEVCILKCAVVMHDVLALKDHFLCGCISSHVRSLLLYLH